MSEAQKQRADKKPYELSKILNAPVLQMNVLHEGRRCNALVNSKLS